MRQGQGRPLAFIGDSITAGWGAYRAETFAHHGFLARGIPGQTSGQIRARFRADAVGARGIHLLSGINDIAQADAACDGEIRDNIAWMAAEAVRAGLPIWIGAVMPSDFGSWRPELQPAARIRALNAWIRDHAAAGAATFIDYHARLATPSGALRPEFTEDGIHLNAAGYAAVEPAMLAALAPEATR